MGTRISLKKKSVVITGASSGIGKALSLEMAKKGCRIALVARRQDRLGNVANMVNELGGSAFVSVCDCRDLGSVTRSANEIKKAFGPIEVAFLNAGVESHCLAQNMTAQEVKNVMETNFFGVIYWLEQLLPEMQRRNDGIIIATSSLSAYRGLPASGSYCASKAALLALWESYQIDLLATGIRLVIVMPYFVDTEMTRTNQGNRNSRIWIQPEEAARRIIIGIEQGKFQIAFPWHFRLLICLWRLLPLSGYRLFWKCLRRGG